MGDIEIENENTPLTINFFLENNERIESLVINEHNKLFNIKIKLEQILNEGYFYMQFKKENKEDTIKRHCYYNELLQRSLTKFYLDDILIEITTSRDDYNNNGFQIMKGFDEVNEKKENGEIIFIKKFPINSKVIQFSVDYNFTEENNKQYKGTIIRKVKIYLDDIQKKYSVINGRISLEFSMFERVTSQIFQSDFLCHTILVALKGHNIKVLIFFSNLDKNEFFSYKPEISKEIYIFVINKSDNQTYEQLLGEALEYFIKDTQDNVFIYKLWDYIYSNDTDFDIQDYDYVYNENLQYRKYHEIPNIIKNE